jgi:hypothetical protein
VKKIEIVFLTEDSNTKELILKYWEFDSKEKFTNKTRDLSKSFGVPATRLNDVIKRNSSAFALDKNCIRCKKPYPISSRSDFDQRYYNKTWECNDCSQQRKEEENKRILVAEEEKRHLIHKHFDPNLKQGRTLSDFSLRDGMYLLSMIRGGATEDYTYIRPISSFNENLSPDFEFTIDILKYVYRRDLLVPHPDSPLEGFSFENDQSRFFLDKVFWLRPKLANLREVVNHLETIFRGVTLPSHWEDEVPHVWRDIVLQEGLELLEYYAAQRGFTIKVGEKTIDVLTTILEDYGVAHLQNFLWSAASGAADYLVRERVPKPQAANSIITRLQGGYERARANSWTVKPYNRNFDLPQTIVSKVFFNSIMKIPDTYREMTPPDLKRRELN